MSTIIREKYGKENEALTRERIVNIRKKAIANGTNLENARNLYGSLLRSYFTNNFGYDNNEYINRIQRAFPITRQNISKNIVNKGWFARLTQKRNLRMPFARRPSSIKGAKNRHNLLKRESGNIKRAKLQLESETTSGKVNHTVRRLLNGISVPANNEVTRHIESRAKQCISKRNEMSEKRTTRVMKNTEMAIMRETCKSMKCGDVCDKYPYTITRKLSLYIYFVEDSILQNLQATLNRYLAYVPGINLHNLMKKIKLKLREIISQY